MRKKGENSVKRAGKADVPPDGMMFSSLGSKVNPVYPADSDSADPHLCVGWAADLTLVVGSEKLRGKLDWSGMAETVGKGLIFRRGRNTGTGRRGGHLKKMIGHVEGRARREDQLVLGESATKQ